MAMPSEDAMETCLNLRYKAKLGLRLHPDDQAFIEKMFKDYPDWYKSVGKQVFERTRPFGSEAIDAD